MVQLRSGSEASNRGEVQAILQATDALAPRLEVRPSQIPGAGLGLFASVDLPAGKPICLYYGELIAERLHGQYCIKVGSSLSLDAEPVETVKIHQSDGGVRTMRNLGRYVNDCRGNAQGWDASMRYGTLLRPAEEAGGERRPPCVVMYSRRRIKAGEELFASYGPKYWAHWEHLLSAKNEKKGEERSKQE